MRFNLFMDRSPTRLGLLPPVQKNLAIRCSEGSWGVVVRLKARENARDSFGHCFGIQREIFFCGNGESRTPDIVTRIQLKLESDNESRALEFVKRFFKFKSCGVVCAEPWIYRPAGFRIAIQR